MTPLRPRIAPHGSAALSIRYASRMSPEAEALTRRHAELLRGAALPGVIEVVAGYVALVVHYDPRLTSFAALRDRIPALLLLAPRDLAPPVERTVTIPVRYDGADLSAVAEATGLTPAEVIALHGGREYRVALLGFVPGFAYLGPLDPRLVVPRRASPRTRVPAGSVAIAGEQTGIYPAETPGGWHLLGTTPVRLFDPDREPPAYLTVGDRVRFAPVDA